MKIKKFELTPGFIILIAWLNFIDSQRILPLAMIACAIHELGHYAAIQQFGGCIQRVRFSVIGAEIQLQKSLGYVPEGIVALAGPGTNLCAALLCGQLNCAYTFSGINLVLGCFNLLPMRGLDGNRVLYCSLALLFGPHITIKIVNVFSGVLLILFGILSVYAFTSSRNITMLLIVIWLIRGEIGKKDGFRSCHRERKGLE